MSLIHQIKILIVRMKPSIFQHLQLLTSNFWCQCYWTSRARCPRSILLTIIMRPVQYTDHVDVDLQYNIKNSVQINETDHIMLLLHQYILKHCEIYCYQYILNTIILNVYSGLKNKFKSQQGNKFFPAFLKNIYRDKIKFFWLFFLE